jgi:hypothetical protein
MNTARIDIPKGEAKGLGIGESISITLTGTIKALETYNMADRPMVTGEKKEKKEPPKVTVSIEIAKTKIGEKPAKTPKQAFDASYEKESKAAKEEA